MDYFNVMDLIRSQICSAPRAGLGLVKHTKSKPEKVTAETLDTSKSKAEIEFIGKDISPERYAEKLSSNFITPSIDLALIQERFPNSNYYFFENRVGNWKPVLIVETNDGEKFVPKRVNRNYPTEYSEIQALESRPNAQFLDIPDSDQKLGLFQFVGDKTMDPTDEKQMSQLVSLGLASARRNTTFDPNQGNLIVEDSKLYYLDQGLTYTKSGNFASAIAANIGHIFQLIGYTEAANLTLYKDAVAEFREQLKESNSELKKKDVVNFALEGLNKLQKGILSLLLKPENIENPENQKQIEAFLQKGIESQIRLKLTPYTNCMQKNGISNLDITNLVLETVEIYKAKTFIDSESMKDIQTQCLSNDSYSYCFGESNRNYPNIAEANTVDRLLDLALLCSSRGSLLDLEPKNFVNIGNRLHYVEPEQHIRKYDLAEHAINNLLSLVVLVSSNGSELVDKVIDKFDQGSRAWQIEDLPTGFGDNTGFDLWNESVFDFCDKGLRTVDQEEFSSEITEDRRIQLLIKGFRGHLENLMEKQKIGFSAERKEQIIGRFEDALLFLRD